ncbi:MAG: c-type cytochrome [Luteolibacter sp.]|jgi:mono/diheme cytochrome c family protein
MPSSDPTPDLEESINVTEAHDRIAREAAAAVREKRIAENGREPTSVWIIVVCGIAAMIAGAVLGDAGKLFAYATTFQPGYVRAVPEGVDSGGPAPRAALAAFSARGARIYSAKCQGCHGPDGRGDGANYPSLAGSDWVIGETQKLAMIILNGMQGPISTGKTYGVMPAQAAGMTNEDLAGVMTYLRNNFGNETGDVVTLDMAAAAFDVSNGRPSVGAPVDADEIRAAHATMLPGDPLDPEVLVNPVNLLPVESDS